MSEQTATATATDELKLTPPDPVPVVSPEKAAGLVSLSTEQKSKLEERVDGFIDDLVAQDENSPNSASGSTRSPTWAARKCWRRRTSRTASSTGR